MDKISSIILNYLLFCATFASSPPQKIYQKFGAKNTDDQKPETIPMIKGKANTLTASTPT